MTYQFSSAARDENTGTMRDIARKFARMDFSALQMGG
jgi:hypothetical protein